MRNPAMHTHDPSADEGRPIDMRLADLDIIQDLFYSDAFIAKVGAMINAEKYVDAMRTLRILCASSAANPYAIAGEWRRVCAILGADLVGQLLATPLEWQQLVYLCNDTVKAWRHHDDYVVVWKQKQGAVIAQRGENGLISFRVDETGD